MVFRKAWSDGRAAQSHAVASGVSRKAEDGGRYGRRVSAGAEGGKGAVEEAVQARCALRRQAGKAVCRPMMAWTGQALEERACSMFRMALTRKAVSVPMAAPW